MLIMDMPAPQKIWRSGLRLIRIINAQKMVTVLKKFGFEQSILTPDLFLQSSKISRLGFPPVRLEITTLISGVEFNECYSDRVIDELDGVQISLIDLQNLKKNKKASGRPKDLADLEKLP